MVGSPVCDKGSPRLEENGAASEMARGWRAEPVMRPLPPPHKALLSAAPSHLLQVSCRCLGDGSFRGG